MVRERFARQLEHMRDDLMKMGRMVEEALHQSQRAMELGNATLAERVVEVDPQIDAMQQTIEEEALRILALQQPVVAGDLRLSASVVTIAGELERVGDYAKGIARRVLGNHGMPAAPRAPEDLLQLAEVAREALHASLAAFLSQDVDQAHRLIEYETRADALAQSVRSEVIAMATADPQILPQMIVLLEMVHLLERSADRATNIGERVIYLATSTIEELNP